jgi:hypothetical protein
VCNQRHCCVHSQQIDFLIHTLVPCAALPQPNITDYSAQREVFNFEHTVEPERLAAAQSHAGTAAELATELAAAHADELLACRSWRCVECGAPATRIVQHPGAHSQQPGLRQHGARRHRAAAVCDVAPRPSLLMTLLTVHQLRAPRSALPETTTACGGRHARYAVRILLLCLCTWQALCRWRWRRPVQQRCLSCPTACRGCSFAGSSWCHNCVSFVIFAA